MTNGTLDEIIKGSKSKEDPKGTTYRQLVADNNLEIQRLRALIIAHVHDKESGAAYIKTPL